ncbi:MAG TPA: MoaD/ThiS family protein [Chitinophagales bacterium]|nr:MoaD/ThiS family protein [Chitinophagales bacterium]
MQLNLLFFGVLTDVIGVTNLEFVTNTTNTRTLNHNLQKDFPALKKYSYKIAVNQEIITEEKKLKDGDEVAFLPPFAGG